ncbi:hypothetical protein G6F61_001369 [Rhizopus arrhizus]|nr:hypothetical protein G6F61_001369 [Rhizopus arrhizus]
MVRSKKQATPEVERLVSKFFKEDGHQVQKQKTPWKQVSIPDSIQVSPLLTKLRQLTLQVKEDTNEEESNFKIDLAENEKIETVRKENMFGEEVTESEMDIIQKRVALQQRQFQEFEKREYKRKSIKIKGVYGYLSDEEISEMLVDCSHDEEEVIVRLTQPTYLLDIRRTIATKHAPEVEVSHNAMSEEQLTAYKQLLKKRSETLKKTTNDSAKKQYRMCGRLSLDEAIRQAQDNQDKLDKAFEGWSQARIRAYSMINENPNSYYYRFNAPGEEQRKGQWNAEERKLFFQRLNEVGANGQWGIFSMTIPGRVGYQCSNFYRLLVETNEIQDPNYVLDEKGKAHYLFDKKTADGNVEKTFRTHNKHGGTTVSSSSYSSSSSTATTTTTRKRVRAAPVVADKKKKKKRRTRGWNSDDDDEEDDFEDYNDDSGTFTMSMRTTRRTRHQEPIQEETQEEQLDEEEKEDVNLDNPLPGFLDPITLEEVVKPAISRYGHVMGYDSWVRCLTNWEGKKNICPLTKKPLTKRDLAEIASILCSLVDTKDLFSLALTCRILYRFSCERLWRTLNPTSLRTLRKIKNTLDNNTAYNKLVWKFKWSATREEINLERLFFKSFLFPNLRELEFSNAATQDHIIHPMIAACSRSLRSLNLSQCYCLSSDVLRPLMTIQRNQLQSLVLYGCGKIDPRLMVDIIQRHAGTLHCIRLTDINDAILEAIGGCGELCDLGLEHCVNLSSTALTRYFRQAQRLTHLRMRDISQLTSHHLRYVAESSKTLIHFDMSECNQVNSSDGFFRLATECTSLETLLLAYQTGVTNQAMQLFLSHCPSLKHVDVSGCRLLTDHAFLFNSDLQLETLNISGLDLLTSDSIQQLLTKLTHLKELCLGVTYDLDEADRILSIINRQESKFFIDVERYYTICRIIHPLPLVQRMITHRQPRLLLDISLPSTSTWNLPTFQ